MEIAGYNILSVSIVDDDRSVREAYQLPIEDLNLDPVVAEGPINDIDQFLNEMSKVSQAVICDQNLKVRNYSAFTGAELVSKWYDNSFPALLCTRWEQENAVQLRKYRKKIPVLIEPDELEPDSILRGFEICLNEFRGDILPSRKGWKTLVRIESIDYDSNPYNPYVNIVVPGWSVNTGVSVLKNDFPENVRSNINEDMRLYATVNLGAERHEDLYFDDWQL